jgi:hypothetical protein
LTFEGGRELKDLALKALKRELVTSTLVAEVGWTSLESYAEYLRTGPAPAGPNEVIQLEAGVIGAVQLILTSAAMVSRLLWPFRGGTPRRVADRALEARASEFRAAIGVGENSLLADREVRNEHTHVEKSVVEWLEEHPMARPAAFGFGDGKANSLGPGPEGCFRYWNYLNGDLKVGEYTCNVKGLVDELRALRLKVPMTWHASISVPPGRMGVPSEGRRHFVRKDERWVLSEEGKSEHGL